MAKRVNWRKVLKAVAAFISVLTGGAIAVQIKDKPPPAGHDVVWETVSYNWSIDWCTKASQSDASLIHSGHCDLADGKASNSQS